MRILCVSAFACMCESWSRLRWCAWTGVTLYLGQAEQQPVTRALFSLEIFMLIRNRCSIWSACGIVAHYMHHLFPSIRIEDRIEMWKCVDVAFCSLSSLHVPWRAICVLLLASFALLPDWTSNAFLLRIDSLHLRHFQKDDDNRKRCVNMKNIIVK